MNNPPSSSYIDSERSRDGFQIKACSLPCAGGRPIERPHVSRLNVCQRKAF
jgi:hypothetical protein